MKKLIIFVLIFSVSIFVFGQKKNTQPIKKTSKITQKNINVLNVEDLSTTPPDLTKIAADAAVYIPDMGSYIFIEDQYYKYSIDLLNKKIPKLWKGYPQRLPGGWIGLPDNFKNGIDAAFYYIRNKTTYFIKDNQYVRLTGRKVDKGYPKNFPGNWKGMPEYFYYGIDAAFTVGLQGKKAFVVLIKNDKFIVFDNWKLAYSGNTKDLWKDLYRGFDEKINAISFGGVWGNYLFSGEQAMLAPGHNAKLAPNFHVDEGKLIVGKPEKTNKWQLPVRNRKSKQTVAGTHNGLGVKLLPPNTPAENDYSEKIETDNKAKDYDCTIQHIDEKLTPPENVLLDPTTSVIWPGAIIDGSSIPTGEYRLIDVPRNKYVISTSSIGAKKTAATIKTPKQSEVRKAVNGIIKSIPTSSLGGKISFLKEEMYSEEQFRLKFGGHYNSGVVNIASELDLQSNSKKHRLVVEFVQEFFSIDMDNFGNYKNWITDPSNIDFYSQIPMYVSSIKYGRRAFMSIESDESINSLKTYFSGSYAGAGANLSTEQKDILKTSKVKVYIVGGDGRNMAAAATGDYNQFINYIKKGTGSATTVMPLAYTLRFLEDNSVAKVSVSSKYTVRNCTKYQLDWKVKLESMTCIGVDDSGNNEELYGMAWVEFYDKNGKLLKNAKGNKIWHRTVDQYVSLRNGQSFTIDKDKSFSFTKRQIKKGINDKGRGAYILLKGWIEEDDDGTNSNDDLGRMSKKIYLSEITNGKMPNILLQGFADGGSKATMTWSIESF